MNEDDDLPELEKSKSYSMNIEERLHQQLEKHLRILKYVEHGESQTKQKWITDAIKEKLKDGRRKLKDSLPKQQRLMFRLNKYLIQEIEKEIKFYKKFRTTYSKKQLIVDAIHDKLEKEKEKTEQFLENLQESD